MDVFFAILAFVLSIIVFKMKEIIIILKLGLTLFITTGFLSLMVDNLYFITISNWTWELVFKTIKSNLFYSGSIIFITIYSLFYILIPYFANVYILNKMRKRIENMVSQIDKKRKVNSLLFMRKFVRKIYSLKLMNPSSKIEEIEFTDYMNSIVLCFCLLIQFTIIIFCV